MGLFKQKSGNVLPWSQEVKEGAGGSNSCHILVQRAFSQPSFSAVSCLGQHFPSSCSMKEQDASQSDTEKAGRWFSMFGCSSCQNPSLPKSPGRLLGKAGPWSPVHTNLMASILCLHTFKSRWLRLHLGRYRRNVAPNSSFPAAELPVKEPPSLVIHKGCLGQWT